MVCGAAASLLAGRDDNTVVALLVGTFVLCAYDDFEPASVVFCPRFYGPSSDHLLFVMPPFFYLSLVRIVFVDNKKEKRRKEENEVVD